MPNNGKNELRNILSTSYPYKGRILDLRVDNVLFPSGKEMIREVVEHKNAVAVLAIDNDGKICLVSQYRHAIDAEILEIPAGLIENGEEPETAAVRELQEEIGCKPGKIEKIFDFYTSPGYSTELITLFYAYELSHSKLPEDDDEFIKVLRYMPEEIYRKIQLRKIVDSKTIAACAWYSIMVSNNDLS
jgi:ADP-ribose pyrophosphatase